jgi:hypothetical protein
MHGGRQLMALSSRIVLEPEIAFGLGRLDLVADRCPGCTSISRARRIRAYLTALAKQQANERPGQVCVAPE